MKLAVPTEIIPGETRVALIPESVAKLVKVGVEVTVQAGAGNAAHFADVDYTAAGAKIEPDVKKLLGDADFVLKVRHPVMNDAAGAHEAAMMKAGAILLGGLFPIVNTDSMAALAKAKVSAFSTDCIPRTTRAQKMDTLSSMATIAGYKAVLMGAAALHKFLPMFMTAAGTIRPSKVFVLGAGVAGLQAIATAKRLGAVVDAYDARAVVKEQVESLGANFVELDVPKEDAQTAGGYAKQLSDEFLTRQRSELARVSADQDLVITTAQVFGKKAPLLITAAAVKGMKAGSVVVDLAAEQGGNCELCEPGKTVIKEGVTIIGELNLPASMPVHASMMWSRNLTSFVTEYTKEGKFDLNLEDEIIKGALIVHNGEVVHELTKKAMNA